MDTFYHAVSWYSYHRLMKDAHDDPKKIVLWGRVFNPDKSLKQAERDGDYEEERGKGYVYATDYHDRYSASPGASSMSGPILILGWDGRHSQEPWDKRGEVLVPLESYGVIGVLDEEEERKGAHR